MKLYCDKQELKKKSKDELVDELYDSLVENEKLKRELRKYKNPNTPPSTHPHLKPTMPASGRNKKRGAPVGHVGTTRWKREAKEERHIHGEECPRCDSDDIRVIKQKHQQVEEMPPEIQPEAINVIRDFCQCNNCGLKFLARDGKIPIQGRFGINLMVLVIFLKFIVRGVLRKTTSFLDASFAMKLAPASVQAIRETVMVRKIIGAFRSEKGTKTYETLASLIAIWQIQKKDIKAELTRMLTTNLC